LSNGEVAKCAVRVQHEVSANAGGDGAFISRLPDGPGGSSDQVTSTPSNYHAQDVIIDVTRARCVGRYASSGTEEEETSVPLSFSFLKLEMLLQWFAFQFLVGRFSKCGAA
jgi:hypothetical protein